VKELGATAGDLAARLKRLDTARVNADLPPINKYFVATRNAIYRRRMSHAGRRGWRVDNAR